MAQKTDLNVAPYYDDFDKDSNFVRTLFRPGFAIQARELTQLQTALQNQISRHGEHMFKEGAMIIPGQISLMTSYHSLKLASSYAGETIDPSQYYNATTPVTITGATTGVTAEVIGYDVATTTDQPTLYLSYKNTGTDGATLVFADGENISSNYGITHTTSYSSNSGRIFSRFDITCDRSSLVFREAESTNGISNIFIPNLLLFFMRFLSTSKFFCKSNSDTLKSFFSIKKSAKSELIVILVCSEICLISFIPSLFIIGFLS